MHGAKLLLLALSAVAAQQNTSIAVGEFAQQIDGNVMRNGFAALQLSVLPELRPSTTFYLVDASKPNVFDQQLPPTGPTLFNSDTSKRYYIAAVQSGLAYATSKWFNVLAHPLAVSLVYPANVKAGRDDITLKITYNVGSSPPTLDDRVWIYNELTGQTTYVRYIHSTQSASGQYPYRATALRGPSFYFERDVGRPTRLGDIYALFYSNSPSSPGVKVVRFRYVQISNSPIKTSWQPVAL